MIRSIFIAVLLFCALMPERAAIAQEMVVFNYTDIGRFWINDAKVIRVVVGEKNDESYGCVEVGFVIDENGRVPTAIILRRAFGPQVSKNRIKALTGSLANVTTEMLRFKRASGSSERRSVFTSFTLPFMGRKFVAGMDDAQIDALAERLRPSCRIADLPGWVKSHDIKKLPDVEILPELTLEPTH